MQRILFVCLGNICRSPMAEFLLRDMVAQQGLAARISVDSAGTSGWHDGEDMHVGTAKILTDLGIDHTGFHSSKVQASDFDHFDYVIAMDGDNLHQLEKLFGHYPDKIFVITDLVPELGYQGVPDPYFTNDFQETQTLLQAACQVLLQRF